MAATIMDERGSADVAVTRSEAAGYRPHLDGLRAVAVYLVVLFHAGVARFSGGYIGVDVFFVLSGYLVTQLLMRDLGSLGRLRFSRFYARRFRRLLPASFVTLIITALVYAAIASPAEVAEAMNAFKAAFLYVANWYFINQSNDYFAADIDTNPVLHFWSLAVEEQFYLLWPILLAGLFAITRPLRAQSHRAMQVAVAAGAVASVAWALHLSDTNINRAYYGTDARAYQLLAGAFLALTPGIAAKVRRQRGAAQIAAVLALLATVVLATSQFDMSVINRGVAITVVTVILIIAIESAGGGPANALLSSGPAAYLGRISYGTYLWHWPVILVTGALIEISPMSTFLVAVFIATGLASLSYTLLERPIREQRLLDRVSPMVIGAGLALSLIGGLVLIPNIVDPYDAKARPEAAASDIGGGTPVPDLDFASARTDYTGLSGVRLIEDCYGEPATVCTILRGGGPHVLVIGDSHAGMMEPTFAKIAQEQDLTLSIAQSGGCPWQRHLFLPDTGPGQDPALTNKCMPFKRDLYERIIPELRPDVIVAFSIDYLTGRPGIMHDDEDNRIPHKDEQEFRRQVEDDTRASLAELHRSADKVLIVKPFPSANVDPFACLTEAESLEPCRFVANTSEQPVDQLYDSMADNERVVVADFDRLACPYLPICDPVINGDIVRFDNSHLTPRYALEITDEVTQIMQLSRLIPLKS